MTPESRQGRGGKEDVLNNLKQGAEERGLKGGRGKGKGRKGWDEKKREDEGKRYEKIKNGREEKVR